MSAPAVHLLTRDLDLYAVGSETPCALLLADGGLICDDLSRMRSTMYADVGGPMDRTLFAGNFTASLTILPFPPTAIPRGLRDA